MQGQVIVKCKGCGRFIAFIDFDTADLDKGGKGAQAHAELEAHRPECPFYGKLEGKLEPC